MRRNGRDAPVSDLRVLAPERGGSTPKAAVCGGWDISRRSKSGIRLRAAKSGVAEGAKNEPAAA